METDRCEVLDIGCYTGFSAMAWFEGTVETGAEVSYLYRTTPGNLVTHLPFADITIFTFIRVDNIFFQIITVEADSHMASVARDAFARFGYDRRIAVPEGSSPDI